MQFSPSPVVPTGGAEQPIASFGEGPEIFPHIPPFLSLSPPFLRTDQRVPSGHAGSKSRSRHPPQAGTSPVVSGAGVLHCWKHSVVAFAGGEYSLNRLPRGPLSAALCLFWAFRSCIAHMSHLVVGAFLPLASSMRTVPSGAPKISSPRSPLWGYSQGVVGSSCIITNPCRHSWF